MTFNPEILIRSILGPARGDIRPLAYAVDLTANRLFIQHMVMDDLQLIKDIYYETARIIRQEPKSTTRRVERLANRCRDKIVAEDWVLQYTGKPVSDIDSPRTMILYLAVYAYFGRPYYDVLAERPDLFTGQVPSPSPPQSCRRP